MYHKELVEVARRVCAVVNSFEGQIKGRSLCGISHGGDPQYNIDQHAEQTAREAIKDLMPNVAIYTEDGAMVQSQGEIVAIVDPIDGTRSAAAGLEMATVSIALAKNQKDATLADIRAGLVMEIKTGAYVFVRKIDL